LIDRDFEEASRWSEEHNIPINIGEFGAYKKADMASRIRWTAYVRKSAEKRGMSWHYWEFYSSFGVYDPGEKSWRQGLLDAIMTNKSEER
jgi:endoglucanase